MQRELRTLKKILLEINDLERSAGILFWDQSYFMPIDGFASRSRHIATLKRLAHDKFISPGMRDLIQSLEFYGQSLPYDSDDASLIRIVKRNYEKQSNIPSDLQAHITSHCSLAYEAWKNARKANDFSIVAPFLAKSIELSRAYTKCFPRYKHIADPLIGVLDYGITVSLLLPFFLKLKEELLPLREEVLAQPYHDDAFLYYDYSETAQLGFCKELIRSLGFNFNSGTYGFSDYPYTAAFSSEDVRITSFFDINNLRSAVFCSMHEAGHAIYEQNINKDYDGTPLAGAPSMAMHESQSRLFQTFIGLSRDFWQHAYPKLQKYFPEKLNSITLDDFYRAINIVRPCLIRGYADELSYDIHIILRFELELELLEGTLAVHDLPQAWNDKCQKYFNLSPNDDNHGVLQDPHWFDVMFGGSFQCYTLGNIICAQYYEQISDNSEIMGGIQKGNFALLNDWLKSNIYRYGAKYSTLELVQKVTQKPLTVDPYLNYLKEKYTQLYCL